MPTGGTRFLALLRAIGAIALAAPASASAASADIAALQVAMGAVGLYPHPVDGISGPWTQSAVRTFQSQHGLAADGIAGPRTRAALGRRGKPNLGARPLQAGKEGWDVAALQFLLHERGFEPGGFDGGFGPNTASAVRRYQSAAHLQVDGVAGPSTVNALRNGPVLTTGSPSSPVRFFRPVPGQIGDGFGWIPPGRWHTGLDFPEPMGTPIHAAGWAWSPSRASTPAATAISSSSATGWDLRAGTRTSRGSSSRSGSPSSGVRRSATSGRPGIRPDPTSISRCGTSGRPSTRRPICSATARRDPPMPPAVAASAARTPMRAAAGLTR